MILQLWMMRLVEGPARVNDEYAEGGDVGVDLWMIEGKNCVKVDDGTAIDAVGGKRKDGRIACDAGGILVAQTGIAVDRLSWRRTR